MIHWPRESESVDDFCERMVKECVPLDEIVAPLVESVRLMRLVEKDEKKKRHAEIVAARMLLEGAGTLANERPRTVETKVVEKVVRRPGSYLPIIETKTVTRVSNPGRFGGRASKYQKRAQTERELQEAGDTGFCKACGSEIISNKAKVKCVDPTKRVKRVFVAVICKSCSQGSNAKMQEAAGPKVWKRLQGFKDAQIRAWIRWQLATLDGPALDKLRKLVLRLPLSKKLYRGVTED